MRTSNNAYNRRHADKIKETSVAWNLENKERAAANKARYHAEHKDQINERKSEYFRANRGSITERVAARRANREYAVPPWADLDAINEIYAKCPPGHHVDHIIPLKAMRGKMHVACGLHCESNLQYLTAEENLRKWAHLPEDAAAA